MSRSCVRQANFLVFSASDKIVVLPMLCAGLPQSENPNVSGSRTDLRGMRGALRLRLQGPGSSLALLAWTRRVSRLETARGQPRQDTEGHHNGEKGPGEADTGRAFAVCLLETFCAA